EEFTEGDKTVSELEHRIVFGLDVVDDQRTRVIRSSSTPNPADHWRKPMVLTGLTCRLVTIHTNILLPERHRELRSINANDRSGEDPVLDRPQQRGRIVQVFGHAQTGILFGPVQCPRCHVYLTLVALVNRI